MTRSRHIPARPVVFRVLLVFVAGWAAAATMYTALGDAYRVAFSVTGFWLYVLFAWCAWTGDA